MKWVKGYFRLLPWIIGMALLAAPSVALAAQFQADRVETRRGQTTTHQLYLQDNHYRLDMVEDGQMLNILVDRSAGRTRIVVPSQKVYLEIDSSGMQSLINNPFESYRYMAQKYQVRSEGSETINGLACDKQVITLQEKDVQTAWVAAKNDFPVKGESKTWQFDRSQQIGSVDITMLAGAVQARVEQPDQPGTIPPSWSKAPVSTLVAAGPQKSAASPTASDAPPSVQTAAAPEIPKSSAAKTTDAVRMVLVLDASGSMWGQIDGKAKIDIAKEVMADLISKLPGKAETGLMVYGHRRKGDCDDIEMVTPLGTHNTSAMLAQVKAISPKGKTPLSEAVKQAAQALRYTEEWATVVLVSDGLETCDIDPCDLAAELAMSGVDFTVHVIGFDLSQEDQGRLRCLADKTGGLFLAADNADSLRNALFATVGKAQEAPPPVVEDPGTATLSGPAAVPVGSEFKVQWHGPDSQRDFIAIALKNTKDMHYKDYVYTQKGNPAEFTAPGDVGDYELRYIHGHSRRVIGRADIRVTPVQAGVKAPASADVATEFEVAWQGPAYKSDYITVARPDQNPGSYINYTYTREGSPLKVRAPSDPGTYEVRYILGRSSKLLAKTSMVINAVSATVRAPASAKVNSEVDVHWDGPGNREDYICISKPDQDAGRYVTFQYVHQGNPSKLKTPKESGPFEVRYILGRGKRYCPRFPSPSSNRQ